MMISCFWRSEDLCGSCASSSQIFACLHVSFTAYENFYKLTKNALCSSNDFHFLSIRNVRNKKPNNQTYIHLYTGSLIHNHIYGRSLSGDLLYILILFCVTRAYANVNQHTSHLSLSPTVCLSLSDLYF